MSEAIVLNQSIRPIRMENCVLVQSIKRNEKIKRQVLITTKEAKNEIIKPLIVLFKLKIVTCCK